MRIVLCGFPLKYDFIMVQVKIETQNVVLIHEVSVQHLLTGFSRHQKPNINLNPVYSVSLSETINYAC